MLIGFLVLSSAAQMRVRLMGIVAKTFSISTSP
jgi:hypothetical protein